MVCSNFSSWLADWTLCSFTTAFISFLYLSLTDWNQCKESNSRYWSSSFRMYATPERGGREGTEKEESTSKASTEERIKDVRVYYQVCLLTHCKAVVCKSSSRFVFLVEFLFAADGVLHKIHRLGVRFVAINVSTNWFQVKRTWHVAKQHQHWPAVVQSCRSSSGACSLHCETQAQTRPPASWSTPSPRQSCWSDLPKQSPGCCEA